MKRMIINAALGDNWVRRDDKGVVVSTNSEGYQLVCYDDASLNASLNADVFHWAVFDPEGNVVLDTGRLGYGYDVSYLRPEGYNGRGELLYGDAIYLKCIADEYGFSDSDILHSLNQRGIRERYKSTCGQGYNDEYGHPEYWTDEKVFDALDDAKSSGLINHFIK